MGCSLPLILRAVDLCSGQPPDLPSRKLDMDGQDELERFGAHRLVEQVVDRRLPFQLLPGIHATNLGGNSPYDGVTRRSPARTNRPGSCGLISIVQTPSGQLGPTCGGQPKRRAELRRGWPAERRSPVRQEQPGLLRWRSVPWTGPERRVPGPGGARQHWRAPTHCCPARQACRSRSVRAQPAPWWRGPSVRSWPVPTGPSWQEDSGRLLPVRRDR